MSELNEVALSFHGVNLGNNGQVGWIVLFARQTIVLLDVIELVQVVAHFWDKIYSGLLGNDNITKIVYNSRPIVDYLYFNHHVTLNNVFDCQVRCGTATKWHQTKFYPFMHKFWKLICCSNTCCRSQSFPFSADWSPRQTRNLK